MKKFPVSFSRLSTFEQCEQKFDYLYVTKSIVDAGNEYTVYGTRVHEALENYCNGKLTELPADLSKFKPMVDKMLARNGDKYFEHQMSLNPAKEPCDWFAEDVWIRGIADVLIVDGDIAWCLDWKTGKPKDNPTQLQLFAALVFIHFPEVQAVKTSFIWLHHDDTTTAKYTRNMLPHLWLALDPRLDRLEDAVQLGVFKAKPSGLCKWCPARSICSSAK